MTKNNPFRLKYVFNICVSLLILAFLFNKVPLAHIFSVIKGISVPLFLLSFFLGIISMLMSALRWKFLLRYLGYAYETKFLSKVVFIAFFFNVYLPTGVLGDIARVSLLYSHKGPEEDKGSSLAKLAASVVADRFVGLLSVMILALIGFIFYLKLMLSSRISIVFGLLSVAVCLMFLTMFSLSIQRLVKKILFFPLNLFPAMKTMLKSISDSLLVYRNNYSVFYKVIPISIIGQLCVIGFFFTLAKSIRLNIAFLKMVLFVPIIEFISAAPVSLGGAGVREIATISLFSSEGVSAAESMSVSLLSFVIILLLGGIGGLFFLSGNIKRIIKAQ